MSRIRRRIGKPVLRVLVTSTLATILLAFVSTPAIAAIIDVNSLADNDVSGDGSCTLREAMVNADDDAELSGGDCLAGAGNDAIVFSTGPGTIELDSGLPFVKTDMSINGPVAGNMVVRGPLGATNFWVTGPDSAILILDRIDLSVPIAGSSLCVRVDGHGTLEFYRGNLYCSAGIRARSTSTLVVDSSTIYGSRPINIFDTGGLDGTTSVTVMNSSVEGTFWPAIGVDASGDAEVIVDVRDSTLTGISGMNVLATDESMVFVDIADSIVKDTTSGLRFGSFAEFGGDSTVHAKVERTTFSNSGEGILTRGTSGTVFVTLNESIIVGGDTGIIHGNTPGHLYVTNSTISGNDIGVENGDDVSAIFTHVTVTDNELGIFGGESAYTNINRTILAGNDIDCEGEAPSSTGYNVVGVNCGISASTADIIGTDGSPVDPRLWGLTSSGGPTRIHRLRADSPAVDRISLATCFIGNDQRGFPRPEGDGCDAGAYELEQADLSITKTDGVSSAVPGESVVYTIVAGNAGASDDPSVSVIDSFPAVLSCTYTSVAAGGASGNTAAGAGNLDETLSMPAGSSVTYTVTCTIDSAATGTLSNTATITSSVADPIPGNNSATDSDTVLTPMADISVTKDDGLTTAIPGETIVTYIIVASNAGPSDDPGVSLADTFPADLTCAYTSVAAGGATGNTAAGSGDLAESLSMPAGSSVTYTVVCSIDPAVTGTLSNTATVISSVTETNPGNNSASDSDTLLIPTADLAVTKEDSVDPVEAGHDMFYTITVNNPGPSDASNVVVSDSLPDALLFQNTSGCAEDPVGVPTCSLGTIAAGGSAQYTIFVKMRDAANNPVLNTASVDSDAVDPQPANNSATQETTVFSVPIPVNNPLALMFLVLLLGGFGWSAIRRS
jgi:uncharacterized repeat protein (TIGR01451 family)/CSLREA domain-containing protein